MTSPSLSSSADSPLPPPSLGTPSSSSLSEEVDLSQVKPKGRRGRSSRRKRKTQKPRDLLVSLDDLPHKSPSLSLEDAQIVSHQLGFVPSNLIEVGSRNAATGHPETVILYGLNKNSSINGRYATGEPKPFPTFIWMSCPQLKARVSKLEDQGLVADFQARLTSGNDEDPGSFVRQMEEAHRRYAAERWKQLSEEDISTIEKRNWVQNLRDVGVAGMRNADGVKCLHCHYAHYLARPEHGNIIGQWTHEALCDV